MDEATINRVRRLLLKWGRKNFRDYPWRSESDPWLSLLAELLLQRTRAEQVRPVFEEIKTRYPTAADMAGAGPDEIAACTDRLGLRFRAARLCGIAERVVQWGGNPPESEEDLAEFTGIGPYSRSAWLSLHRNRRAIIIDSNIARWLGRFTGIPVGHDPRGEKWLYEIVERLTPRRRFKDFNYALLDFTMNVCTAKKPGCNKCPLSSACDYPPRPGGEEATEQCHCSRVSRNRRADDKE